MSYCNQQREKSVKLRDKITKDAGQGMFFNKPREFVLKKSELNLMEQIRTEAMEYFSDNKIPFWHTGEKRAKGSNKPSGHMLSSQIACINHLLFFRKNEQIATAILKAVDSNVKSALKLDNDKHNPGFVSLEVIGKHKYYLNEKNHSRGANATSIDAAMLGEMNDGKRKLFLIEWKYVEQYKSKQSKFIEKGGGTRKNTYLPLLKRQDCPIFNSDLSDKFIEGIFYEPFYQLMGQTLLAHEMIKGNDFGAEDFMHIHMIPEKNIELKQVNTSKKILKGNTMEETWKNLLKSPEKYMVFDPSNFLKPARQFREAIKAIDYLEKRYWT